MNLNKFWNKVVKPFTLGEFPRLILLFGVASIVLAVTGNILEEVRDTQTENDTAYNATVNALEGIDQLSNWLEIIALVIAATIVIGILMTYFGGLIRGG